MPLSVRYGAISDTHGHLPASVYRHFAGVERIFHCGDIGAESCLYELEAIAPVIAVAGNMDPWHIAGSQPQSIIEEMPFGRIAIAHGMRFGHDNERIARGLLDAFAPESPRVILFGHSHIPYVRQHGKTLVVNPGSASIPKGAAASVAILHYELQTETLSAEILHIR